MLFLVMKFSKSFDIDDLSKLLILIVVSFTFVARCSPLATTIPESELSVGHSERFQLPISIAAGSGLISTRRPINQYQFLVIKPESTLVLTNNLSILSLLTMRFQITDVDDFVGELTVWHQAQQLTKIQLPNEQLQKIEVFVNPKSYENISFRISSSVVFRPQNLRINIVRLSK